MDKLAKYLSTDLVSCPDLDNLKAAIVACIYVQVKPTLGEIASWIQCNRDVVTVITSDVNYKTIGYMLLCLQRHGCVKRVVLHDEDVYTLYPIDASYIADLLQDVPFRKLDTTPVSAVVCAIAGNMLATCVEDETSTLNQSVFYASTHVESPQTQSPQTQSLELQSSELQSSELQSSELQSSESQSPAITPDLPRSDTPQASIALDASPRASDKWCNVM